MKQKDLVLQIIFVFTGLCFAYLGREFISLADLRSIMETLQNVSAAVFTLAGIWVAYSYPEAIARFTNPNKVNLVKGIEHTNRIRSLVLTIFSSAFVLVGIIIFNLVVPYMQYLFRGGEYYLYFKIAGIFIINYLALIQVQAIVRIMSNNLEFIYSLMKVKVEHEVFEDLSK